MTLGNIASVVRDELLEGASFLEHDLRSDLVLQVGGDLFVQRSDLYGAIRSVLSGASVVEIIDRQNRKCRVEQVDDSPDAPRIILSFRRSRVDLTDYVVLSPDERTRLGCFDALLRTLNLSRDPISSWRTVMSDRALEDHEVHELMSDIANTPVRRMRTIQRQVSRGEGIRVDFLVPRSRRYFERLVGAYDGSDSIQDYACGAGRRHIQALLEWEPCNGFFYSLLLSAHSSLVNQIDVERIDPDDLMRSFRFLEKRVTCCREWGRSRSGFG